MMERLPRGNERNTTFFVVVSEDKEDKEKRQKLLAVTPALFVEIILVLFAAFVIEEAKEIAETLLLMRKDIFVTQSSSRVKGKK